MALSRFLIWYNRYMRRIILGMSLFLGIFSINFIFGQSVAGHTLGQSFEKNINGYLVDVGYSAVDKVYAGETIRFNFNLWTDKKNEEIADFDYVWVRIAPQEGISFAGFLHHPELLLTGMSYTFQDPGRYELTVRFLDKNEKPLTEASFPLVVERSFWGLSKEITSGAVAGIFIGSFLTFLLMRKRTS